MLRWVGALLTAAVLSGFAVLLLTGEYVREGPVLVTLTATHGIHRGDVGIAAFWALGMIGLLIALLAGRRDRAAGRRDERTSARDDRG
jgi:hypothetical protein